MLTTPSSLRQAKNKKLSAISPSFASDEFFLWRIANPSKAKRPPFRATGTLAVLKRVAEDTPRSIREVIPETPQWLCDIISKLHAKKPEDRFQNAAAALAAWREVRPRDL